MEVWNCKHVQETLEVLLAEQLTNAQVAARYAGLWAHLAQCRRCHLTYVLLRDVQEAEAAGELPPLPHIPQHPLAFLPAGTEQKAGWRLPLILEVAARQVGQALQGLSPELVRGGDGLPAEHDYLLFSQVLPDAGGDLFVQVVFHAAITPEDHCLDISLVSDACLPEPLELLLEWGEQQCCIPIGPNGSARVGNLPWEELFSSDITLCFA